MTFGSWKLDLILISCPTQEKEQRVRQVMDVQMEAAWE